MTIRQVVLVTAATFFAIAFSRLTHTATRILVVQQTAPAPDCQVLNPCTNPNQSCQLRGGHCSDDGEDGENGYKDPNGDGCGCQL